MYNYALTRPRVALVFASALLAVALLALGGAPDRAHAAGAVQQIYQTDHSGNGRKFDYYDMSGAGTGPWAPMTGISDDLGNLTDINQNGFTGDTGAQTASFAGATQTNTGAHGVDLQFQIGAVSGSSPTLVAKIQVSPDGGATWSDLPGATTASQTATGNVLMQIYPGVTVATNVAISAALPRTWRVYYTIGGSTPSFTITNVAVAYIK